MIQGSRLVQNVVFCILRTLSLSCRLRSKECKAAVATAVEVAVASRNSLAGRKRASNGRE